MSVLRYLIVSPSTDENDIAGADGEKCGSNEKYFSSPFIPQTVSVLLIFNIVVTLLS